MSFFLKKSSRKRSFGHVECKFPNSAASFSPKVQKIIAESPERLKSEFFEKKPSKSSSRHVACSFDSFGENFYVKVLLLLKVQDVSMKSNFFVEMFSQKVLLDSRMQFLQSCRKFIAQSPKKSFES